MRAGGDDLAHAGSRQRLDVRPCLHLEQVLVAEPSNRVTAARLGGTEDGKAHPGLVQQAGDRLGRPAGPVVECPGAADPEEVLDVLGDRPFHHGDLEVQARGPLEPSCGPEAPRVAPVLDVAQHERGFGREPGLDHDLVTAHVDDRVDMLDVDRALLDARAASGAGPEDVLGDDTRHERLP